VASLKIFSISFLDTSCERMMWSIFHKIIGYKPILPQAQKRPVPHGTGPWKNTLFVLGLCWTLRSNPFSCELYEVLFEKSLIDLSDDATNWSLERCSFVWRPRSVLADPRIPLPTENVMDTLPSGPVDVALKETRLVLCDFDLGQFGLTKLVGHSTIHPELIRAALNETREHDRYQALFDYGHGTHATRDITRADTGMQLTEKTLN
jgi:hypothetical protein